jgi:uncharacterized protein (DUF1015 family)
MAQIEPLRALRYDLNRTGGLDPVIAPPYDVIDDAERAELAARSPYNVVHIDLPRAADPEGDPYEHAAGTLASWRSAGVVVRDQKPAIWPLEQLYVGPDGRSRSRRGFLARVRIEPYGAGRIRPHERTHPGPREDRLRLTRATGANLSPIFSLYSDPDGSARRALDGVLDAHPPYAETTDASATTTRLWCTTDPATIDAVGRATAESELLIADGHHRYETARVHAEEVGGEGAHRYVLMCLVALEDPGLTVFPTHRLVRGLSAQQRTALAETIERHFESSPLAGDAELPPPENEEVLLGYLSGSDGVPRRLRLRDREAVDRALAGRSEPYRRLDTAVLEALVLRGALRMTDEQIDHLDGLGYARDDSQAIELVRDGSYDAAFFMAPTPVARVQAVAASGETMPPKSTYFVPKVPTGLLFNPLFD